MTAAAAATSPRRRRVAAVVVAVAGALLGVVAEQATRVTDVAVWVPDLAVGWTFLLGGVLGWYRRPSSRTGLLLAATGIAWFVPNFSLVPSASVSWLAAHALYLYRGPLIQVLVTFPTGRAGSRLLRSAVVAGYLAAMATPVWRNDPAAVALTAALVAVVTADLRLSRGRARRAGRTRLVATGLFALVVAGGAMARMSLPAERVLVLTRWATEVGLCLIAVWLVAALLASPWDRVEVTDLVVELGEAPSDGVRDQLARALGDPGLTIGYRVADDRWVDARGHLVALPSAGSERVVTVVRADGLPVAALVHDPAVLDTPGLVDAVRTSAALAAANVRLQAGARGQVEDLAASRRRLLEAGDDERQRLEQRLHDGARRQMAELGAVLSKAQAATDDAEVGAHLAAAEAELSDSLDDLTRLARGLHPRELDENGLVGALRAAADRSPVPVSLDVDLEAQEVPLRTAVAAYYVCLEGLSNAVKHGQAERIHVKAAVVGAELHVEVVDGGIGGATVQGGRGLRGLVDRVEALDGSVSLESTGGQGTRLAVRLPLEPAVPGGQRSAEDTAS